MNKAMKLITASAFLLCCTAAYSKEIASVPNNQGGMTILTDQLCPVDSGYLYGVATGTSTPTIGFCWQIEKSTVIIYLPLNKTAKIPLSAFSNSDKPKETRPNKTLL